MKRHNQIALVIIAIILAVSLPTRADDSPHKISIAPENDLSRLIYKTPRGAGFGSSVTGANLSKEFAEGYKIGTKNDYYGRRNILMIDDGKAVFPAIDKDTGLSIVILTDARITEGLQDLVRGYNKAMRQGFEQRKKRTEHPATRSESK